MSDDEASLEREKQRSESEARDIIHDVQRLYTFPEEMKSRWIWELLQNAKDVADADGIKINIRLTKDKLYFSHNGKPFETKHLLAILYKTSTKSLSGEDGTTGRYGTGFVTTHILNKQLTISGVHVNSNGKRRFSLNIDRSPASLDESVALDLMQKSLSDTFAEIQSIGKKENESIVDEENSFIYELTSDSYKYAEKGLDELKRNVAFTLLVNKAIKEINVETPDNPASYRFVEEETGMSDIKFAYTNSDSELLFHEFNKLIFAIPVLKDGPNFELVPLNKQAVIFKEFPLIGTEGFNLPVFVQHRDFHPTELRDGIRTKIVSADDLDPIATKNRGALIQFIEHYLLFIEKLLQVVGNGHVLAKSGLPENVDRLSTIEWHEKNIQLPIRNLLRSKSLVTNVKGQNILISEAKFILGDIENKEEFYELACSIIPEYLPNKESIWQWSEIIAQEQSQWAQDLEFTIKDLVNLVQERLDLNESSSFDWLINLYKFLEQNHLSHLGDSTPIYPTENGSFKSRDNEIFIHPNIDDEFKMVSKGLGRDLNEEFLHRKVGNIAGIKTFDIAEFHSHLNKNLINELDVDKATLEQIKSILHLCALVRSERAFKREGWLNNLRQLLPEIVPEKKIITTDYENYYRSADLWSVKYVCYLIEQSRKPSEFNAVYFDGHEDSCFQWYNDFLNYVFSIQGEAKDAVLKKSIIPVQSDEFRPYDDYLYAEFNSKFFDDTIKNLFNQYLPYGDPRKNIVDRRIRNSEIRTKGIDALTNELDKLFHSEDIDRKVRPNGEYNSFFLSLCAWVDQFQELPEECFTKFKIRRPYLNIIALGEGFSKQMVEIKNSGKSLEDIKELAKIKLSAEEMRKFESAAEELGADQLLAKAQEMIELKAQRERWKRIGNIAEDAFKEAISGFNAEIKIDNPDHGMDFDLVLNSKGYFVEVKNVIQGKENVRMSILQGRTASENLNNYALCVITRISDTDKMDIEYFRQNAKFVINIGEQIKPKLTSWDNGLSNIVAKDDISIRLDEKKESVYVNRPIWRDNINFDEFTTILKEYFKQYETN